MREVSSKEYALRVQDEIESTIEVDMFDLFNELAEHFGFPKQGEFDEFAKRFVDYVQPAVDDCIRNAILAATGIYC